MKSHIFCKGDECPIRNQCLRYTKRNDVTNCIGGYSVIRKCTQQKRFLQDESRVNQDSKRNK